MKYETATILIAFFGLAVSAPVPEPKNVLPARMLRAREVPQEHSHNDFIATVRTSLNTNNPQGIEDPIFGLLGNAAAAAGAGSVTDLDCLQQATADQAFTNAKAAGDVTGMTAALVFRALERNTGSVGLQSVLCTETATNPEIDAISQHQDPASTGAAATNKAIVLELAKQINSIGGDPQTALKSGTFAPGNLDDNTGKGNTCDVADDTVGCIFSQNLLVEDATAAEISAAVAGATEPVAAATSVAVAAATTAPAVAVASDCPAVTSAPAATQPATVASSSSALDFGSCSDPAIVFGAGFDGRTEDSFEPANKNNFNHGSADNIAIISSFICGQLSTSCKASAAAVSACTSGETAASSLTGQAAADAFNSALGVSGQATGSTPAVAATTTTPVAVAATPAATTAPATAAVGANVQTFTGDIGGLPPAVINTGGDRPFSTDNNTFVNAAAAIQRSCSVQHNACANAVNSGSIAGPESKCEDQENACNALIQ